MIERASQLSSIFTRRVWFLMRASLKVKVKGQGHQGRHFSALSAACMQFMSDKISLASSFLFMCVYLCIITLLTCPIVTHR